MSCTLSNIHARDLDSFLQRTLWTSHTNTRLRILTMSCINSLSPKRQVSLWASRVVSDISVAYLLLHLHHNHTRLRLLMLVVPLTPGSSIPKRSLLPAPIRPLVSAKDLSQKDFAPRT